jgi:preprotein translocase subunit SecD
MATRPIITESPMGNMSRQSWLLMPLMLFAVGACAMLKAPIAPRGGVELTLQVSPADPVKQITERDLESVKKVIENRIKGLGVTEPLVEVAGQNRIRVQLPGMSDLDQAERVLGGMAQLDFREQIEGTDQRLPIESAHLRELQLKQQQLRNGGDAKAIAANKAAIQVSAQEIVKLFKDVGLTGKGLTDAFASNEGGTSWSVAIRFDREGGEQFMALTKRLAGQRRAIGIFLDNVLVSAPVVGDEHKATGIQGGGATITGNFDAQSANELAVQIKGGALPVPVQIVEKRQM